MSEILGVLFAAMLTIMFVPKFVEFQKDLTEKQRNVATAQQQRKLYAAAEKYIQANSASLNLIATNMTPVTITISMLQSSSVNLLSSTFPANNPYGQSWVVEVLRPSAGMLQALVTAKGGQTMIDRQSKGVATLMGADGGFIPLNDSGLYPGAGSYVIGAYSGAQSSTAYYGVTPGRPAALITVADGQLVSNYLYRNAVPGQPQLNQMRTSIDMTGNSILAANQINGANIIANKSGEAGLAEQNYFDIQAGRIGSGKSMYSYGNICAGSSSGDCNGQGGVVLKANGDIDAAANVTVGGETTTNGWFRTNGDSGWYSNKWGGGFYMKDKDWVRTLDDKGVYTGGQVQAGTLQSNGDLNVAGNSNVGESTIRGSQVIGGTQTVYGSAFVTQAFTPGQIATDGGYCLGLQGAIALDANHNLYICN